MRRLSFKSLCQNDDIICTVCDIKIQKKKKTSTEIAVPWSVVRRLLKFFKL